MRRMILALGLLASLGARPGRAEIVCVGFIGTVAYVDNVGILEDAVSESQVIDGYWIYDSEVADTNTLLTVGDYWHRAGPAQITVDAGRLVFRSDGFRLEYLLELADNHGAGRDNYLIRSYNNLPVESGVPVDHISYQLDDDSGGAIDAVEPPLAPPTLSDWESWFGLTITGPGYSGHEYFIRAHLDSVQACTQAPLLRVAMPRFGRPSDVLPLDPVADVHVHGFASGARDPEVSVLADWTRAVMFYGLDDASATLLLVKAGDRLRIFF